MGEAAVVGWLVCPVIRIVVDKARSCASDRFRWLNGGVPDALKQLEDELNQLRAEAGCVERCLGGGGGGRGNCELVRWLRQLKEVVYEADDVLDEFAYRRLAPNDGKVSLLGSSSIGKIGKQLVGKDESVNRLKAVVEKLSSIRANSGRLMQAAGLTKPGSGEPSSTLLTSDGPVTGSILEDGEVFGRDKEREQLVSWLIGSTPEAEGEDRSAASDTIPVAAIIFLRMSRRAGSC
jgi:hypothetical protein